MELIKSEKRIEEIFYDLQKDREKDGITINLIDRSRRLKPDKDIPNAGGDKRKNEIKYNSDFFHRILLKNDENLIRFILLHEEAHITKGKSRIGTFLYLFLGIVVVLTFFIWISQLSILLVVQEKHYEISNMTAAIIFFIVCYFVGVPAIWRYNWDQMYGDELLADKYGAECLFLFLNDPDPSKTVTPYFTEENSIQEKERIAKKIVKMKFWGVYPDYHPSNSERLVRIRQLFQPESSSSLK
jgi:Zn-dependent protease with chaperone function